MQPLKPRTPKKVYKFFILYYTIVDYSWIDPESEAVKKGILKPGWHGIKKFNPNHPLVKASKRRVLKAQAICKENAKGPTRKQLEEIVITL